jgi:outer membrane receptor for ferrienterochelin and colicins
MRRPLLVLVLGAALIGAPALADNTADEADVAFNLGNDAYARRDYDRALSYYFLSHRLVPNRNVLFNIAKCFEAKNQVDEAYRYYNDLLPLDLPADDRREVKTALARLAPKVALLTVTSDPPGADIYVDREDLGSRGKTPQTLAVNPGSHKVILKLGGHRGGEVTVNLARGREAKQKFDLKAILGRVKVTGTPEGAVVRERPDGPELGRLPASFDFKPGQVLLHISAPGFLPSQALLKVEPEGTATATVELTVQPRPTGKVVVTANREGAEVRVDGVGSGFTPTVVALPEGEHLVEVVQKDLRPYSQRVTVVADQEVRIVAELRYAPPPVQAASKSLVQVDDSPASITVITREEILGFGWQTLADAMQAVRGVFTSSDRIYSYVGVRGFSPPGDLNTRILILWDGHSMNDVWAGQGFSARDLDVDLTELERIEVVRGPGSALYGTGAFFAVVNLVPRKAIDGRNVEGVVGAGGQLGVKARATGSYNGKSAGIIGSVAGFISRGAETTDLQDRGVVIGLDGERSIGATLYGRAGDFSLSAKWMQRRKDVSTAPFGSAVGAPGTTYVDARGFAEARFEHAWERLTLNARAYFDGSAFRGTYAYPDESDLTLDPLPVFYEQDLGGAYWFGAEARGRMRLFGENFLTLGLEGQGQLVRQATSRSGLIDENYTRVLLSAFLLDEWRIHPRFSVTAGVRLDKYLDLAVIPITPRAGLVIRPYSSGVTKVGFGRAFRAPNIYELYYNDANLTQRAAQSLNPETITTFELEHSHDFTEEFRVTIGGYHNLIDELVVLQTDEEPVPQCGAIANTEQCLAYANAPGTQHATGAELQLRWQPGRNLLVDVTYSFAYLWDQSSPAALNAPQHVVNARALVPIFDNYLRVSLHGLYQSPRGNDLIGRTGEALLLNLGLSGEFKWLRWYAGVQNLLDQRYRLPIVSEGQIGSVPQDGRTFWLELSAGI